jgi:hypothetical protein
LLTWWYAAQIVKPKFSQVLIVSRLGPFVLALLHLILVIVPLLIWANWKVALVVTITNLLASMKAGAVSTDIYVQKRAAEMRLQNPQLTPRQAQSQAEAEMRANVNDDSRPDPYAGNHRDVVDAAERIVADLLSELNIGIRSQFRMGTVSYTLSCFDLRIAQFYNREIAARFVHEAQERFARIAGVSVDHFSGAYKQYAPAFYAVQHWAQHGGPSDRDERFRGMQAAEKFWEIIANGPMADTSIRTDPNTKPDDPGGSIKLMQLQVTASGIGNFCKSLHDRGVRL